MPFRSVARCTTAGESAGTDGSKRLVPRLESAMAAGETEASDLHETFPDLLLHAQRGDAFVIGKRWKDIVETGLAGVTKKLWQQDQKGLLRFKGAAYVSKDQVLRDEILKVFHDDPLGVHYGANRTLEAI